MGRDGTSSVIINLKDKGLRPYRHLWRSEDCWKIRCDGHDTEETGRKKKKQMHILMEGTFLSPSWKMVYNVENRRTDRCEKWKTWRDKERKQKQEQQHVTATTCVTAAAGADGQHLIHRSRLPLEESTDTETGNISCNQKVYYHFHNGLILVPILR